MDYDELNGINPGERFGKITYAAIAASKGRRKRKGRGLKSRKRRR